MGFFVVAKTFQDALKRVLKHEGGYIDHPSDPGGETNFGITKAVARNYGYSGSMRNIPADIVEKIRLVAPLCNGRKRLVRRRGIVIVGTELIHNHPMNM